MISLKPQGLVKLKKDLALAKLMDFTDLVNFNDDPRPFRVKVADIEERLMKLPLVEVEYDHAFHGGIYLRTMIAPRGTLMTSYIYRKPHHCIISKGNVSYASEINNLKIEAPYRFHADAGSKRIVYCHTDMVWTTVIQTDATTVAEAEKDIYLTTYEEWDNECCDNIIEVGG